MKIGFLPASPLFQGITENELGQMLDCVSTGIKTFHDRDYVFRIGESIASAGLILVGAVNIVKNDVWGDRKIIEHLGPGQVFGETYACLKGEPLMVSAEVHGDTKILFMDISRLLSVCEKNCRFHSNLIRNLLVVFAKRNLMLTRKMDIIMPKSIRGRLLVYLSYESMRIGKNSFEISFNRQQLADYLSVDRSALSSELSKMQRDGIIHVKKNEFELLVSPQEVTDS